ncbi:MAG: bifunctional histidinol-phosphatase/imidazoleglycerol-phosphate dehydratase HisB [Bacteroidetes bacterium]|nr:bifunctional histidinol-phosphatase/imidazoleglycerol-phosphate dehydratase HisB [Bacteroidota bacterium]
MTKLLFIDRDGTLVQEPPEDYQLDRFEKLAFLPGVFRWLGRIVRELDYELVMVTNQDGLGTDSFPEADFWGPQNLILQLLEGEGIQFREVLIDRSFPEEKKDTRKPGTGMLKHYLQPEFDLANSFVIGDRLTDMELAKNLGGKGILINGDDRLGADEIQSGKADVEGKIALQARNWEAIYEFLRKLNREAVVVRKTKETEVEIRLELEGTGNGDIQTGLSFFDHMLDQVARHSGCDLYIRTAGDLEVDEHHTIEDTALALGQAFRKALGRKTGIERYGYCLPMDDALAQVALDFGGRPWLEWEVDFKRERIGDVPAEMFFHFFKSFSDEARCNLNIQASAANEHHLIESVFKAFARSIGMAIRRKAGSETVPTTKGML